MTDPHITDAEIAELRRLHDAAKDQGRTARARSEALSTLADRLVWNWFDGTDGGLPRLLAEIERLRAELEEQRALNQEARDAMPPGTQGPGLLGGVLHLREQLERLRAELRKENPQ